MQLLIFFTVVIDLDEVEDEWISSYAPIQICTLAHHHSIFKDLFGPYSYFYPTTVLNVAYDFDEEYVTPVYFGNIIKPNEVSIPSIFNFIF